MSDLVIKRCNISFMLRAIVFAFASAMLTLFTALMISWRTLNIGVGFGMLVCLVIMLYTLSFRKINEKIADCWRGRGKIGLSALLAVIVLGFAYVICATVFMVRGAYKTVADSGETPVVIVLGCQVMEDGPSTLLEERIDAAYEYLVEHPECPCIVSGGQGADEVMSEAQCMYNELVKRGISAERIHMEDRSTSTQENLAFSKSIMDEKGLGNTAVLVTNGWHEFRAQLIAEDLGMTCGAASADTPLALLPCNYIRELFGIAYQVFL